MKPLRPAVPVPPAWDQWAEAARRQTGLTVEALKRVYNEEFLAGATWMNERYVVIEKPLTGGATHLSIRRRDRRACRDWRDFQAIKNQLCGAEREAVELYPAESRVVDTANQFHLWVLPEGMQVPLGWRERCVAGPAEGLPGSVQRPLDAGRP